MISIKKDKNTKLIKLLFTILAVIIFLFIVKQSYISFVNKSKVESLKTQIELQKNSNDHLINKTKNFQRKTKETIESYATTEEIETRLKDIFKRMSILDYELILLTTKKMCIDRHVLVARLDYKNQNAKKAGLGILNYLGTTKQSLKDENVYFVDYIADKKVKQKIEEKATK